MRSPLDFAAVRPHRTAVIPAVTPGEPYREADVSRTTTRAALLLIFTYTYLANAWVGDDAYITFRTVWNFVHGFGLTFNPDERVQAYTHPLWMLVISAAHFVTREFFFTQNVVLNASLAVLRAEDGLKELYGSALDSTQYSALMNLILTF